MTGFKAGMALAVCTIVVRHPNMWAASGGSGSHHADTLCAQQTLEEGGEEILQVRRVSRVL